MVRTDTFNIQYVEIGISVWISNDGDMHGAKKVKLENRPIQCKCCKTCMNPSMGPNQISVGGPFSGNIVGSLIVYERHICKCTDLIFETSH